MKKNPKFSGIIKIPGEMELLSNEIGWMRLANFETQRQLERVSAACMLVAKDGRSFPEAYRWVMIREKEGLLAMLKRQLKGLNGMHPPDFILRQMNQDIKTVEKAIARLKMVTAQRMANKMAHEFDRNAEKNALELSTRFVGDVAYDLLNGGAMGRAKVKKLMAE